MAESFHDFATAGQSAPAQPPQSFHDFTTQAKAKGRAPDWTDDVKSSASFLGNELLGVGDAINPINIVKGVVNTIAHPIDTATGLVKLPGQMVDQYQSGDLDGLARNIGNIAGSVALAGAGKLPVGAGATGTAAEYAATGAAKAGSAVAGAPLAATAKLATLMGVPGASAFAKIPKYVKAGTTLWKMAQDAMAEDAPAPTPPAAPKPPASTLVLDESAGKGARTSDAMQPLPSTNVGLAEHFSPQSVSEVAGTKPVPARIVADEPVGKGPREEAPTLSKETQDALVEAHRLGKVKALEPAARKQLVEAVATGDDELAQSVLKHGAVSRVETHVANKVSALTNYARAHGINLNDINTPQARQTFADAAHAYAKQKGLEVPKGRYKGISDDTFEAVRNGVSGQ